MSLHLHIRVFPRLTQGRHALSDRSQLKWQWTAWHQTDYSWFCSDDRHLAALICKSSPPHPLAFNTSAVWAHQVAEGGSWPGDPDLDRGRGPRGWMFINTTGCSIAMDRHRHRTTSTAPGDDPPWCPYTTTSTGALPPDLRISNGGKNIYVFDYSFDYPLGHA